LLAEPRSGFLDGVFDLAAPYGTQATPRLGQLLFPEQKVPAIRSTNMWRNAQRIAAALLGLELAALESWGHLIFKAPHSTAETPWHQDEAYWDVNLAYRALGSWLALDDVDTTNGCLWFVPGSHRRPVLQHRHLGGDPAVHVLELDEPTDTSAGLPVPLAAGGMTFHHSRTLHYAGTNTTDRIRRAWANEFQSAPVKRDVPAQHSWFQPGLDAMRDALARTPSTK
jgi:ectoine hydroxylase-related dioxygenase (phytanoyl-CoA dioxygenase family)